MLGLPSREGFATVERSGITHCCVLSRRVRLACHALIGIRLFLHLADGERKSCPNQGLPYECQVNMMSRLRNLLFLCLAPVAVSGRALSFSMTSVRCMQLEQPILKTTRTCVRYHTPILRRNQEEDRRRFCGRSPELVIMFESVLETRRCSDHPAVILMPNLHFNPLAPKNQHKVSKIP